MHMLKKKSFIDHHWIFILSAVIFHTLSFRVCLVTKERRSVQNNFSQCTFVTTKLLKLEFNISHCFCKGADGGPGRAGPKGDKVG